jgi:hypothetical protein
VIGQGPADFEAAEEMADTEYMLAILDNLHIYRFRVQGFRGSGFKGSGVQGSRFRVQGFNLRRAIRSLFYPHMKLHIVRTANRRISNIEPQNVEGWNRFAQSFLK